MFSEQNLHKYGTPLPLLELDQVPSKKAVYVQDQIATDDQGRRRFHGAFTGGFSAGYWNTVGSKEGWAPQSFKSSRREKAPEKVSQRPEDFMDDEDRSEFGIAPKGLKIKEDFTSVTEQTEIRKRKFFQNDLQPIPGEPVLRQLIKPIKDKAAVRILKSWGWRPGQGIGPRQTKKEKKKARERNKKEMYLMEKYGCEIPTSSSKTLVNSDDESDETDATDNEEDEITFAPEDCELPSHHSKKDKYGIGYEPLSRHSVLGGSLPATQTEHINLFPSLEAVGKNNQKISFSGQAFGVGALEDDDDEDVYVLDDMTRYDFTLEDKKSNKIKKKVSDLDDLLFGEFKLDRSPPKIPIYKVQIPFGWHPRNWNEKRSRFEPLDPKKQKQLEKIFPNASSETNMTREKRAELLGEELRNTQPSITNTNTKQLKSKTVEELQQEYTERKERTKSLIEKITAKSSSFTKGGIINMEGEETPTHSEVICSNFKPFAIDEKKQERYEKFLAKEFKNEQEIEEFLNTIQPIELSAWDRQMELKEFQQAKKLYKPLQGIMSNRFITESEIKAVETETKKSENKQIVVERTKQMWKPHNLLCKRYNIAEPYKGLMEDEKKIKSKQKKLSVFDYIETSVNKKEDFQTPVIVPKNIEKPKEIVQQTHESHIAVIDKEKAKESTTLEWEEVLNPSEKSVKGKKGFTFKPKTELERRVVESINKPLTEKKELFKAIFSDSESEEDVEIGNSNKDKGEIIPILSKPLNAAAANVLRNNSPPRGIFKSLFTTSAVALNNDNVTEKETSKNAHLAKDTSAETSKVLFQSNFARELKDSEKNSGQPEVYGPALPQSPLKPSKSSIDQKLLALFNKHKTKLEIAETWVEKSCDMDANNTHNTCETFELSSNASHASVKLKKKSKKSKKKNALEHKHNKHKEKYCKSSRKHAKKKKKHKKK